MQQQLVKLAHPLLVAVLVLYILFLRSKIDSDKLSPKPMNEVQLATSQPTPFNCPQLKVVFQANAIKDLAESLPKNTQPNPIKSLAESLSLKTDKFTGHNYDLVYDRYFPPYLGRDRIKMLEIGLGCGMPHPYTAGASTLLWTEYFKSVSDFELHVFEYNKPCAEAWFNLHKLPKAFLHTGDQSNITDLERAITSSGGNFDIIIDDGGHTMKQQIVSVEYLFPNALKPGGIYIIEDLHTSILRGQFQDFGSKRTNLLLQDMMNEMTISFDTEMFHRKEHVASIKNPVMANSVIGLHCIPALCVLEKMSDAEKAVMVSKGKVF